MEKVDIEETMPTVDGLCKLAKELGYKDPAHQLMNSNGSCVGDLLYLLEDNPGAIEVLIEWLSDNLGTESPEEEEEELSSEE